MELNREHVDQRDLIIFNEPYNSEKYLGGIRRFHELGADEIEELLGLGVLDLEDAQNRAPTAGEIFEFVREHPNFYAHGYTVSPERDDYRVTFEGVECTDAYTWEDMWAFHRVFAYPDELEITPEHVRCWYD